MRCEKISNMVTRSLQVKAVVNINGPTFYLLPAVRHPDDNRHEDDVE